MIKVIREKYVHVRKNSITNKINLKRYKNELPE